MSRRTALAPAGQAESADDASMLALNISLHGIDMLLRRPEVERLTGLSRSSIYRLMATGDFPRPKRSGLQAVAWPASVIRHWIETRETAEP